MNPEFAVDIPNSDDPENSWVNLGQFDTHEEAVEYCKTAFGADNEGRIGLISELPEDVD